MRIDLSGLSAVVSGSTAGIGLATAKGLAGIGARVIVNGRTNERVDAARASILAEYPQAAVVASAFDLSAAKGAADLVEAHPNVDVLVNSLGIRTEALCGDSRWRLVSVLRNERYERRAPEPRVSPAHDRAELGPSSVRLERVCDQYSRRDGALWRHESRGAGRCPRHRRDRSGDKRHCEQRIARPNEIRRPWSFYRSGRGLTQFIGRGSGADVFS